MTIKELFAKAEGPITYDQFAKLMSEAGAKFEDLSTGNYVSKQKYDADLAQRDTQIETLNTNIGNRDKDLTSLQEQLKAAGADATKLADLTSQLTNLQTKYETDTKNLQKQLTKQGYEFAVKEFANGKKFSSQAARRDFISSLNAKNLRFENGTIYGAEDFATVYAKDNPDAFVTETAPPTPTPQPQPTQTGPMFVQPTNPQANPSNANPFHFSFNTVRPMPTPNK